VQETASGSARQIVEPDCTRGHLIAQDAARKVLASTGMARLDELRLVFTIGGVLPRGDSP
jgi:hypothetical protein